MKQTSILFVAGIAALACSAGDPEFKIASTTTLKDGSVVRADFLSDGVNGSTAFLKDLSLKPEIIDSLTFKGTNGEARVTLTNKDNFALSVADRSYKIESSLGTLDVPTKNIRSITFRKVSTATGSQDGLVFYCTFDNAEAVKNPAVGPSGTVGACRFVEDGKVNGAAYVPAGGSAGFFTLPPEILTPEGSLEFWAKIDPQRTYYRDCDPRMIFIKSPMGWLTIEFSANNGAALGGFNVRVFNRCYHKGGHFGGQYTYGDVLQGDVSGWHHYAISWDAKEASIYIDGQKLMLRQYEDHGDNQSKFGTGTASLGLPNDNSRNTNTEPNSPFTIDELKIWNYAKSDFN